MNGLFFPEGQEQNSKKATSWTLIVVFFEGFIMSDSLCRVLCSKTKLRSPTEEPFIPVFTQFNPYVLKPSLFL